MSVIPCEQDAGLRRQIERFAEVLKTQAHKLGDHGLTEKDFYASPIFRCAIQQVRGEFSATMRDKREFVQHVLNHMEDRGFIASWDRTKRGVLHDYVVNLKSGRTAIIDLNGCLDGDNTKLFERPSGADEFVIWSLCTNVGADPRRNAWSGIHTRISAEIVTRNQLVDGLVIWDMMCGTIGRSCPKLARDSDVDRRTLIGPFCAPPPCIYVFPASIPSVEAPSVRGQQLSNVELLAAFQASFRGHDDEINYVNFDVAFHPEETMRRTTIERGGIVQHSSEMTAIRRG
ncbi:hypothetical protein [Methylocystis sp. ATCC 49242]|uniref:hypothetical protein n=1 Tax=Methylocystis sp. ATCC 49242 TaxID=622637 RepID=UPI0001F8826E|nr:hypothetical protein [Methylocystis sp. ATCC 49242]